MANLPEALAPLLVLPNWVLWRYVLKNGEWTKPPFQLSGQLASSKDPATWTTYDEVIAAYRRGGFDGIGFVLTDNIAAFDVDHCRSQETQLLNPWAKQLVAAAQTYAEVTVSGEGIRVIGLGTGAKVHNSWPVDPPMKCEIYRRPEGRFITISGKHIEGTPDRLNNIDAIIDAKKAELEALKNSRPAGDDEDPSDADEGTSFEKLPAWLVNLLHFPNLGKGVPHGKYATRSELAYAFITGCLRARAGAKTIIAACLDERRRGCAVYEHCNGASGRKYVAEQIKHAREDLEKELDSEVAAINKSYALVLAGNKAAIMKFERVDNRDQFRLLQPSAFKQWFSNRHVTVGQKLMPIAEHWLKHAERRQYQGVEFAPTKARENYFNLWSGFAVEPQEGDCAKFLDHLKKNVAKGNPDHFKWIVGWFAQIAQQLHVKTGTSLVLRGRQGTGKTIVGLTFGSLFGEHYELVSDPRYVVGQFNSHMASLLILHCDEAFWAGDKRAEGKLKDLVTGTKHRLEYKGIDPILVNNYVRLFVTSNADWVVPAGFGERRFAIFDVGEGKMKDRAYFGAIVDEMNRGGREALLHHLLNFDLSKVDLGTIPNTEALLERIVESATPEQAWWLDTLKRGQLPKGIEETNTCPKRTLFKRYIKHTRLQGVRRRAVETKIGMFLAKYVGPDLKSNEKKHYRLYHRGEGYLEEGWIFRFPSLWDCRQRFAREMQQAIEWGPNAETTQWVHEPEVESDDDDDGPF